MAPTRKISLVLADVDGTLVTEDKVLTARAQAAVRRLGEVGIRFAITSGRPPRGIWAPECGYRPAGQWDYPVGFAGEADGANAPGANGAGANASHPGFARIGIERRGERALITLDSKFLPYKEF